MTEVGKQALLQELDQLRNIKRKEALERIKTARNFCDFREDSEYDAAIKSQTQIEARIGLLLDMLQNAEIISGKNFTVDKVLFGTPVTFIELPNGEEETYRIVGIEEANPLKGLISNESPLAKGLLGHSIADVVTVKTPSGEMKIRIVSIG